MEMKFFFHIHFQLLGELEQGDVCKLYFPRGAKSL